MQAAEPLLAPILALSEDERAWAAQQLLNTLPEDFFDIDVDELAECDRRMAEFESDPEKHSLSHEEFMAEMERLRALDR